MGLSQEAIDRIFAVTKERVERMQAEFAARCPDGIVVLPFQCYSCDQWKENFALMTGDGLPMCTDCISGFEEIMQGEPSVP